MESSQSSMSRNNSQSNIDPLDGLIDFSEYDTMGFNSPSISPADNKQQQFTQPDLPLSRANSILPSNHQTLSGPSHPYDMHKQQTGIPTGGLATTMAINSNYQMYAGNGYLSGVSPADDFVDIKFGSNPSSGSFDSVQMNDYDGTPVDPAFFFPPIPSERQPSFVKPSALTNTDNSMQQPGNVGRLWPGMHQQQAMAKAQQSQRQQQHRMVQQQQRQNSVVQQPQQQPRSKVRPATDPLVEEKIAQLLNSMRQKSDAGSNDDDMDGANNNSNSQRSKKDEEDMDEDERLLASEEGKKLSSKERRQLRNKVSARAFRSRRKEYIGQLEGEIANKVGENQRLMAENKALTAENARLQDLTRLLLGHPSFSQFLNELSTSPTTIIPQQPQQQQTPPTIMEQPQQEARQAQLPKDPNPYIAQQQQQDMNIGFAMIPEQTMDFSMLDLTNNDFIYQPQVFSVHSVPEVVFDTSILSEKPSSVLSIFEVAEEKEELPVFPEAKKMEPAVQETEHHVDEEFDSDPKFALFTTPQSTEAKAEPEAELDIDAIVANIKPAKAFLNFELVDSKEVDASRRRFQRLCANLDAITERLESLHTS